MSRGGPPTFLTSQKGRENEDWDSRRGFYPPFLNLSILFLLLLLLLWVTMTFDFTAFFISHSEF